MTMTSGTFTRLTGASLIIATSMVGCSGAKMGQRPALATNQASGIAMGIDKSLAGHDYARALLDAERLVEASPREATPRSLLGRAYLANGRYASARTAFEDAMTLGAADPRTLVSLSLIRTAMGDPQGARALLSAHIDTLPASDYGLAMAMAGDVQEGVRALMEAVHAQDATAQTRQNLAYALALGGEWGQARLVAGQDLNGNQLQQRLTQWAATAQGEAYPQRVAAFLGVNPRGDDGGLPTRLALSASEPTSMAEAQPMEATQMAAAAAQDAPPADLAAPAAEPQPTEVADAYAAFAPAPDATPAPLIRASADPMRAAVMERLANPVAPVESKAAAAFARPHGLTIPQSSAAVGAVHGGSDWVVQIGAFGSGKSASTAWSRVKGKAFEQRGYRKVSGTVTLNGHMYHRLAMSGFDSRSAAASLCDSLRSQGQSCFVRRDAGVASDIRMARATKGAKPVRTAVITQTQKIASR
jgi:Flp pilus assembly protein TadD